MTEDDSLFSSISKINGGKVTFGDNSKGKVIGVGNTGDKSSPSIEKMFLVNNLKHNLLSISQLCDKGYKIMFDHACCIILENDKVLLIGNRKVNVYKIKIDACIRIKNCLVASINDFFFFCIED
jgi:intein/homing endonuclease